MRSPDQVIDAVQRTLAAEPHLRWGRLVALLEGAVAIRVDLVDLSQPNLPLVGPLLTERVVLDREPQARRTCEAETTSRWLDFKPSWEEAERIRTLAMQRRLRGAS